MLNQLYLIAALAVLLMLSLFGNIYQNQSANAAKTAAAFAYDRVVEANQSNARALSALKASVSQCEDGRLYDATQVKVLMTKRDAEVKALKASSSSAKKALAKELAGRCKSWSELPTCGLEVPTPGSH